MGFLSDLFGGGPSQTTSGRSSSNSTQDTTQQTGTQSAGASSSAGTSTSQSNIADWARPYAQDALSMGRAVADQQYNQYTPAGSGLSVMAPYADRSAELTERAGSQFSLSDIGSYMNPHVEATLDPTIRSINRAAQDEKYGISDMARQAGAFGGSRQAILEAESDANRLEKIGDATARAYSDAYNAATDDAMRAHQLDQAGAATAAGQFAQLGGMASDTFGRDRSFDYGEFLRGENWNSDRLGDYLSAVSGVPIDRSTVNTEQSQSQNLSEVMQLLNSLSSGSSSGTNSGGSSTEAGTLGTLGGLAGLVSTGIGLFSDQTMKQKREKVSGREVLDVLDEIDFDEWEYKHEPGVRRFGPMAQDMEKKAGIKGPRIGGKMTLPPNEMASLAMAGVKALRDEIKTAKAR